jgi:hypothetical protein
MAKKKKEPMGPVSTGKEDLTEKSNELKIAADIAKETKGQITDHIDNWAEKIYDTYKKSSNELSVSLTIKLKGDSQTVKVDSTISFSTGKITDKTEGEVSVASLPLFDGAEGGE